MRGVFIRAPRVEEAGRTSRCSDGSATSPCSCARAASSAASFHPELTDDTRIHERFLELVREEEHVRA